MSPFVKARFESALRRLDEAICLHEEAADSGQMALIGMAYGQLLMAKGELSAVLQHAELEDLLAKADTDRPAHMPPKLMLVRR